MQTGKTAVVLGAYGLIGSACVRALKADGFRVIGVGRSVSAGRRSDPEIGWLNREISSATASDWRADLADADVVINASGALQDGSRDDLAAIHQNAIARLTEALAGSAVRFVQISAAGATATATTGFLRTKMRGDAILTNSDLDWVVLRPTLVIGPQAYGGTALLRASAAFPLIGMQVYPDTPVQTVFVEDVAHAVVQAARGEIAQGTIADLTETGSQTFDALTRAFRSWQGFAPRRWSITIPRVLIRAVGRGADVLGWLGWRSPLRTTALKTLEDGVTGDSAAWLAAGGAPCRPLAETLRAIPATAQERWFARLYLLLPVGVATLAVFWMLSGLIGILSQQEARQLLTDRGLSQTFADISVIAGSVVDAGLGLAILIRPWARRACIGMVAVSVAYLVGGTLWATDIWLDPLGPFLKVLPGIALALFVAAVLEER